MSAPATRTTTHGRIADGDRLRPTSGEIALWLGLYVFLVALPLALVLLLVPA